MRDLRDGFQRVTYNFYALSFHEVLPRYYA